MSSTKFKELVYIINDTPKQRVFNLNHFEDDLQADMDLLQTWNQVFDMLPIELGDILISNQMVNPLVQNAIAAQETYYHMDLCFDDDYAKRGYVLPLTYGRLSEMLNSIRIPS